MFCGCREEDTTSLQNKKEKKVLDPEATKIVKDPNIGVEKKGDLHGVFVRKFKIHTVLYLLSYRTMNENTAMNYTLIDPTGLLEALCHGHIENLEKSATASTNLEIICNNPTRFSRNASSPVRISTSSNN